MTADHLIILTTTKLYHIFTHKSRKNHVFPELFLIFALFPIRISESYILNRLYMSVKNVRISEIRQQSRIRLIFEQSLSNILAESDRYRISMRRQPLRLGESDDIITCLLERRLAVRDQACLLDELINRQR